MVAMSNSVYTNTARFDDQARALTETELRKVCPSLFAVAAHESRSERFKPIPTYEVVQQLAKEGFSVVGAKQSNTFDETKRDFTKHMLRIRRLDETKQYSVGDNVLEIILKNANDGTSAYDLDGGMWRIRCKNSLVTKTSTLDSLKVRHSGDVASKVIEGTYRVLETAEQVLAAPQDWAQIKMNRDAALAMANAARVIRFGDHEGKVESPITADQLLVARRQDDKAHDLWTQWNVIQENCIKGGLTAVAEDRNGRMRRRTTRQINGIDQDVRVNKALWMLGEEMAKLMKVAA